MWSLDVSYIVTLQTPGGDRFADFVNRLIRAHSRAFSIPDSDIRTNLKTTVGDGSVDAEIRSGSDNEPTGRMQSSTAWQYKATSATKVTIPSLKAEINKHYAKSLITNGYRFIFCICDQITPVKKNEWEAVLLEEARTICPTAPIPMVVDANDITAWANDYPAFAIEQHPLLAEQALTFQAWRLQITASAPTFVELPSRRETATKVRSHVSFESPSESVVLTIRGPVGIGKSRLIFEVLKEADGVEGLVLYTQQEQFALRLAAVLENSSKRAILVADECSTELNLRLEELLGPHADRVRIIAIESTLEDYRQGLKDAEWIDKLSGDILEAILEANFPQVTYERRKAYLHLSGGFARIAIELCRNDARISSELINDIDFLRNYIRTRLNPDEIAIFQALCVVDAIGYVAEVSSELGSLVELLSLDRSSFERTAQRLRNATGFVSTAGRYMLVEPPAVAAIGFNDAWHTWIEPDISGFIHKLSEYPTLLRRFLRRVATSATSQIQVMVGQFFRDWVTSIDSAVFTRPSDLERLITLVELLPQDYLPTLTRLVKNARSDQLNFGRSSDQIRWSAVKLAMFPEFFESIELILFRLNLEDRKTGRSGQSGYQSIMSPFMSGTAISFEQRLEFLSRRAKSQSEAELAVVLDVIEFISRETWGRGELEPIVAGKLLGNEWNPATWGEYFDGIARTVELLAELTNSDDESIHDKAWKLALGMIDSLVRRRLINCLSTLFISEKLPKRIRELAHNSLSRHLHEIEDEKQGLSDAQRAEYKELLESLAPRDSFERISTFLRSEPWDHSSFKDNDLYNDSLIELRDSLLVDPQAILAQLGELEPLNTRTAFDLGKMVGIADTNGGLVGGIIQEAFGMQQELFTRGYAHGKWSGQAGPDVQLDELLDSMEGSNPELAAALALECGVSARSFERVARLIKQEHIPATWLQYFRRGIENGDSVVPLSVSDFSTALELLLSAIENDKPGSRRVALELASAKLESQSGNPLAKQVLSDTTIQESIWLLLEKTIANFENEQYSWMILIDLLAPKDSDRALTLLFKALETDDYSLTKDVTPRIAKLGSTSPSLTMEQFGRYVLGESRYSIWSLRSILESIPANVVMVWLDQSPVDRPSALAEHMPVPTLSDSQEVTVPDVTTQFLKKFGADDQVFRNFCVGSIRKVPQDDSNWEHGHLIDVSRNMTPKMASTAVALVSHDEPLWTKWSIYIEKEFSSWEELDSDLDRERDEIKYG